MTHLPINAVERETGLNKDLLRMWERRYGFPAPLRDVNGDRLYPPEQVEKLSLLRRLLDQGHRPGRLMKMDEAELRELASPAAHSQALSVEGSAQAELIALLGQHDVAAIQHYLHVQQTRQSLRDFVCGFLADANRAVGDAWMRGQISIAEEQLYTEQVIRVLRQLMQNLPLGSRAPRCLLTTVSGELHGLGLLMVEAILRLAGCNPVNLGPNLPLLEIASAAKAHRCDVVILSYSAAYPATEIAKTLQDLQALLPANTALWSGGHGVRLLRRKPAGVQLTPEMADLELQLAAWQSTQLDD